MFQKCNYFTITAQANYLMKEIYIMYKSKTSVKLSFNTNRLHHTECRKYGIWNNMT